MQIKKKYLYMIKFASLFNKFNDCEDLVEVTEDDKFTLPAIIDLKNQLNEENIEIPSQKTFEEYMEEFIDKYDYDGDEKFSIIDISVIAASITGKLNGDPKYDKTNKTYNGKSLDANRDSLANVTDLLQISNINNIIPRLTYYIDVSLNYSKNSSLQDAIINYYSNHNYTWPTISQVDYYSQNNTWT